jgi:hypothetical protein
MPIMKESIFCLLLPVQLGSISFGGILERAAGEKLNIWMQSSDICSFA